MVNRPLVKASAISHVVGEFQKKKEKGRQVQPESKKKGHSSDRSRHADALDQARLNESTIIQPIAAAVSEQQMKKFNFIVSF